MEQSEAPGKCCVHTPLAMEAVSIGSRLWVHRLVFCFCTLCPAPDTGLFPGQLPGGGKIEELLCETSRKKGASEEGKPANSIASSS